MDIPNLCNDCHTNMHRFAFQWVLFPVKNHKRKECILMTYLSNDKNTECKVMQLNYFLPSVKFYTDSESKMSKWHPKIVLR